MNISPSDTANRKAMRSAYGVNAKWMVWSIRKRCEASGEGAVRHQHPDRLSQCGSRSSHGAAALRGKSGQYHHVDGSHGRRQSRSRSWDAQLSERFRYRCSRRSNCGTRRQPSSEPSDQIARRGDLGNGTGARHAARHAQHKGFSGRRSRRSGALQPVKNGPENATLTRKYFHCAASGRLTQARDRVCGNTLDPWKAAGFLGISVEVLLEFPGLTWRPIVKKDEKPKDILVGVAGFEPATPASRTPCSTGLSHTPTRTRLIALGFAHRKKPN